jgi:hypothetical protein
MKRALTKPDREWCGRLTGVWPLGHCTYEKGFYEWPSFGGNRDFPVEESPLFHVLEDDARPLNFFSRISPRINPLWQSRAIETTGRVVEELRNNKTAVCLLLAWGSGSRRGKGKRLAGAGGGRLEGEQRDSWSVCRDGQGNRGCNGCGDSHEQSGLVLSGLEGRSGNNSVAICEW